MPNSKLDPILVVVLFLLTVVLLYMFAHVIFKLGTIVIIVSILGIGIGLWTRDDTILKYSIIGFAIGIIFIIVGGEIISFLELNPTGQNLLKSGNEVVNATVDTFDSKYPYLTQLCFFKTTYILDNSISEQTHIFNPEVPDVIKYSY